MAIKLGYVSQDPFLFEGSLEDNIIMDRTFDVGTQNVTTN